MQEFTRVREREREREGNERNERKKMETSDESNEVTDQTSTHQTSITIFQIFTINSRVKNSTKRNDQELILSAIKYSEIRRNLTVLSASSKVVPVCLFFRHFVIYISIYIYTVKILNTISVIQSYKKKSEPI